jgi:hypothetical protein
MAVGCVEELPQAQDIEDTRVLGARVEVAGDPERAWPAPGETARISLLVVHPRLADDNDDLQTMFVACTRLPVAAGPPMCLELFALAEGMEGSMEETGAALGEIGRITCADLQALGETAPELMKALPIEITCADGDPTFELAIPEESEAEEKLVLGVTCDRGRAYIDPESRSLFGCEVEKEGRETLFSLSVPIQVDEQTNHHPTFGDAELFIGPAPWVGVSRQVLIPYLLPPKDGDERFDCVAAVADGAVPGVNKDDQVITVELDKNDFESYEVDGEKEKEELRVAHYSTAGRLTRNRSVLKGDEKPYRFEVDWDPPGDIPETGKLVRFFFGVRDRRGGFDSTERALCVTGP